MVSVEQFFELIKSYNNTFWPLIFITYFLGLMIIYLSRNKSENSDKIISGILAFLWIWSGLVFWIGTFGSYTFTMFDISIPGMWIMLGIGFIVQGCIFIFFGIMKSSLSFKIEKNNYFYLGIILIIYAMVLYPIIGFLTGRPYPVYPTFGIAPCPITIFTFGILFWTNKKVNVIIIIFPLIYSLCGIIPLVMYGVIADLGLIIFGIIGSSLIVYRDKQGSD